MLPTVFLWLVAFAFVGVLALAGYSAILTRRIAGEAERKVPPVGRFLEVDGNRIHYVEQGQGRPIVFVHGLGAQLHHFLGPIFPVFGDGYRLVALDRPGSGYSLRARGATGALSEQAAVLAAFIAELGLERPLLVGHSLGGAIALTLAVEHPDAISGLALIAPLSHAGGRIPPQYKALQIRFAPWRWLVSRTVAVPAARKYVDATLSFIFAPQAPVADYMTKGGGWAGLRPGHVYATMTDFSALPGELDRIETRYGEITMPAGLLFGTADEVLDFQLHGAALASKIPALDFEPLEGLGHMPNFVGPGEVAAFVRRIADRAFAGRPAIPSRQASSDTSV